MSAGVIASSYVAGSGNAFNDLVTSLAPIVWWKLGENYGTNASGVVNDSSGNGRHGAYTGVSGGIAKLFPGLAGTAVSNFDNSSKIALAHASWMSVTNLTCFVFHTPAFVNNTGTLMAKDNNGVAGQISWRIRRLNAVLNAFDQNGLGVASAGNVLTAGVPTFVGYEMGAGANNARIYQNGVRIAQATGGTPAVSTGALRVMALSGNSETGQGYYQHFAMFDRLLSDADFAALWAAAQ